MDIHRDHYNVFNKIKEELQRVNDAISDNSILLRQEQINALEEWKEARLGLLYQDSSNIQAPLNSINLFKEELVKNRQRLRDKGLNLLDYIEEMEQFNCLFLKPFQIHISQTVARVELEYESYENSIHKELNNIQTNGQNVKYFLEKDSAWNSFIFC
jgi:hypothetical protein